MTACASRARTIRFGALLLVTLVACGDDRVFTVAGDGAEGGSTSVGDGGAIGGQGGVGGAAEGGAAQGGAAEGPAILSAFWGVDGAFAPPGSPLTCSGLMGPRDGMPIVLSGEVDQTTLEPSFITIELMSGATRTPACATLAPADEENEDRTVLLIGDLGSVSDPPVAVRIDGALVLEGAGSAMGARIDTVAGLAAGPRLVVAEAVATADFELGEPNNCPPSTAQIVRTIWSGGVDGNNGVELGPGDLAGFVVEVDDGQGDTVDVMPIAFGDLNDGDNNVDLCLDDLRPPRRVRVAAGTVTDPTNDFNDTTDAVVVPD